MIRRLAYVSRPRPDLPPSEISCIVVRSRINNAREGMSGVLVYNGTDFAQLIEGPPAGVAALWEHIKHDDRHHDIALLFDESAAAVSFPDWRMATSSIAPLPIISMHGASWLGQIDAHGRSELRGLLAAADSL